MDESVRRKAIGAAVAGLLVGGAAVLAVGPIIRSQAAAYARARGLLLEVDDVSPGFGGVSFEGVTITLADVSNITIRVQRIDVGWDQQLKAVEAGKMVAEGPPAALVQNVLAWRDRHRPSTGGAAAGPARERSFPAFDLRWRESAEAASASATVTALAVSRTPAGWALRAPAAEANLAGLYLGATDIDALAQRDDDGWRVHRLLASTIRARANPGRLGRGAAHEETAPGHASADHDARRVASRRAALVAQMQSLARAVARRVPARAQIAAEEADVVLETGDGSRLRIGPGKLSLTHPPDRVALEVTPAAGAEQALGLRVGVPLGASDARTIDAKLDGGPIALNLHGEEVVSGDMRLRTSLQLSIPLSTKKPIHLEGSGSIRGLQLTHPRIADQTLAFPEVAWKGPVDLDTERFRADFRRLELNLGDARAVLNGHIALPRDAPFDVDVEFEIPIVTCQQAFDAIPQGMTPSLDGAKFEGSIHAQGHARFTLDSRLPDAKRLEGYSMGWTGDLSCRASHMPAPVRRERFRKPFDKLVYSPERVEKTMTFGPTTPQWTPLGSISRFMVASVLTTEDGRFFRHSGFDQEAIVNSIEANLRAGRFVRGASTISMQLAKNLYLPRTKTISRKLEEAILTIYLEQTMTKEEMMEMYLNIIEYGPMVYGIGPAARHYFRKSAGRLSLGQAMYLASILPSPNVHHFGAGGAVNARYMSRLHAYMKVTHKIGRISDEELEEGLRETAVLGQPAPLVTRPLDESNPYEEAVDPAP